ncbi:MAG TPA: solute carrier family 23 protein [Gemmatimonas sp.]|nr:solute carrier family 23 protein [Gemmatimonas sp.]
MTTDPGISSRAIVPVVAATPTLRFDRGELAGAFGDIGTDLPLLVGVILATGLDPTTTFVVYGGLQILSGVVYRLPMPVQPLKAMAAIAIAGGVTAPTLAAGGLIVGVVMLLLALSGTLGWIARIVPKPVVRGIQVGLGLQLAQLAITRYVPADGPILGWGLGLVSLALVGVLIRNRKVPAALIVIALGVVVAAITWPADLPSPLGLSLPRLPARLPTNEEFLRAASVLALPQLALSLGNSVLATRQVVTDFFPEREPLTVRRIGTTYALMNLVSAPLGGLPVCHGSGGIAGHYAFGARTGGSIVMYGVFLIMAGLFLSNDPLAFQRLFPSAVLGALLLVEAVTILSLVRDLANDRIAFTAALLCGLVAVFVPYGYAVALVAGTLCYAIWQRREAGAAQ